MIKCKNTYTGITLSGKNPVCSRLKHHLGSHEARMDKSIVTWYKDADGVVHSSMSITS